MEHYDLLVIGGGAAGMAAALSCEKNGISSILLVERNSYLGGVLPQCLHKGFGMGYFKESISGAEYGQRFAAMISESGIHTALETIVLSLSADKTALLSGRQGMKKISFSHCILASGCRETPIGSLPISGTRPSGIFTAGTAQRLVNLYNQKIEGRVVILGGGDIGQIMAKQLTQQGAEIVAVIDKESQLGGRPQNRRDCIEALSIPVILNSTVEEISGDDRITGVVIKNLVSGKKDSIPCDNLITSLGLIPERELISNLISTGNPINNPVPHEHHVDGFPDREALPSWLTICGNCDYVHDIVDSVTFQGIKTAESLCIRRKGSRND